MAAKRWGVGVLLLALSSSWGCCRLCDRFCGQHTSAASPVYCVPAQPALCCYPTAPQGAPAAAAAPQGGWTQSAVPCVCPPAR